MCYRPDLQMVPGGLRLCDRGWQSWCLRSLGCGPGARHEGRNSSGALRPASPRARTPAAGLLSSLREVAAVPFEGDARPWVAFRLGGCDRRVDGVEVQLAQALLVAADTADGWVAR
jgi:hypothetical protein